MTTLRVVLVMLLCGCAGPMDGPPVRPPDPLAECLRSCGGCCDTRGLCRAGSSVSACGTVGTVCAVCPGDEGCWLNQCRARPATPPAPARTPMAGDLTFRWRFSGQGCAVVREVSSVTVDVPGLALPGGGVFPCASGAAEGVTVTAVPPGLYHFTVRGRSAEGAALYEARGLVTVDGPVMKRVELEPVAGATGRALVSWRLPPASGAGAPCEAMGATHVAVAVSGRVTPLVARCDAGSVELAALPAGQVRLTLTALDGQGVALASGQESVAVLAGATVATELSLTWRVGALWLRWALVDTGVGLSCGQAGAAEVFLNLRGPDGAFVFPGAGVAAPCEAGAAVLSRLPAGRYEVFAQAVGAFGALFRSGATAVQVTPGGEPPGVGPAPLVVLAR
ncbi:MAG: hypothetical protein INH41_13265 [Myxococcaceae bacterium]|jgi:hypothetical protein|nr:hypothetical protein [Myxococcaceae bacterium]